jgi:hypothetical protein
LRPGGFIAPCADFLHLGEEFLEIHLLDIHAQAQKAGDAIPPGRIGRQRAAASGANRRFRPGERYVHISVKGKRPWVLHKIYVPVKISHSAMAARSCRNSSSISSSLETV